MSKLPLTFYQQEDVLAIAKDLLGKILYTNIEGKICSGIIVETEAYAAPEDKASHAFGNKRTNRTAPFYLEGGVAYVYLCYGIHSLFNIITNKDNVPHAVLIRAIEPMLSIDTMMERRNKTTFDYTLTQGPGSLSQALGISLLHNTVSLLSDTIWIEESELGTKFSINAGSRIGVGYAEEYAEKPWRFWIDKNPFVSRIKKC